MVHTTDIALHIGNKRIDPRQHRGAPRASPSLRLHGPSCPVWRRRSKSRPSQLARPACGWRVGQPWPFEPCAPWSRRSRSFLSPASAQGTHGDAALLPSHLRKDHPKPFSQRRSRLMEDGPRGEGGLAASCLALIKAAGAMQICMMVLTPWAMVALWQTQMKQVLLTCPFCGKFSLKFSVAHRLLLYRLNFFYCNSNML